MALFKPEDQRFRTWHMSQMWFGGPETGNQVWPSPDDAVIDWDSGIWRVTSVGVDGRPELELYSRMQRDPALNPDSDSLITSLSDYQPSLATPAFLDKSKDPMEIVIDTGYPILEASATKMIFFKGTDVSTSGIPVSQTYVGSVITDNDVALYPVDPGSNIQRPEVITTKVNITAGELITGVVYDSSDRPVGKRSFVVIDSAAIRPVSYAEKTIVDISLKSDLIDTLDKNLINNDLNIPFAEGLTEAFIHYSDGTTITVPVDGNKMVIRGLSDVNASQAVKPFSFTLMYFPDANEPHVNTVGTNRPHLVKSYRMKNIYHQNTYGLKLFCVPHFIDVSTGFELKWYLCNIDRDVNMDVTSDVEVRKQGGVSFEPANYGTVQILDAILDTDKIAPGLYNGFILSQRITLKVEIPHVLDKDAWVIDYNTDGNNKYGLGVEAAIGTGVGKVPAGNIAASIANGRGDLTNWLHQLYDTIEPIFDTSVLDAPPVPTHFMLAYEGINSQIYSVSEWADELPVEPAIGAYDQNKTLDVIWLLDGPSGYGVLGHSPLCTNVTLA